MMSEQVEMNGEMEQNKISGVIREQELMIEELQKKCEHEIERKL